MPTPTAEKPNPPLQVRVKRKRLVGAIGMGYHFSDIEVPRENLALVLNTGPWPSECPNITHEEMYSPRQFGLPDLAYKPADGALPPGWTGWSKMDPSAPGRGPKAWHQIGEMRHGWDWRPLARPVVGPSEVAAADGFYEQELKAHLELHVAAVTGPAGSVLGRASYTPAVLRNGFGQESERGEFAVPDGGLRLLVKVPKTPKEPPLSPADRERLQVGPVPDYTSLAHMKGLLKARFAAWEQEVWDWDERHGEHWYNNYHKHEGPWYENYHKPQKNWYENYPRNYGEHWWENYGDNRRYPNEPDPKTGLIDHL